MRTERSGEERGELPSAELEREEFSDFFPSSSLPPACSQRLSPLSITLSKPSRTVERMSTHVRPLVAPSPLFLSSQQSPLPEVVVSPIDNLNV